MKGILLLLALLCQDIHGAQQIQGPITSDFSNWLKNNGYSKWVEQFQRADLGVYGSYGGRTALNQPIRHNPVVFIHGNSDQAIDSGKRDGLTGWTKSMEYFMSQNYSSAELYATTWGPADIELAEKQVHSCDYLQLLRAFTQAVIDYTGASKISMVSHSMGVTLARKVVKGGLHTDEHGTDCDIGPSLTNTVDTFVGICGGNRGLALCFVPPGSLVKSCNNLNGFYPGICLTGECHHDVPDMSKYLRLLNDSPHRQEGQHIYSMWSQVDEVIGYADLVWGEPTSKIPDQDGEKVWDKYGHIECKDKTADVQFAMITLHTVI